MINKENIKSLLAYLSFEQAGDIFSKHFPTGDFYLKVDFKNETIIYPEDKGLIINERQTCNFGLNENFVVLECVNRLFDKGYKPEHIELEPTWKLGRGASGGRADVFIRNQEGKPLLLIECKTAGKEFDKAWKETYNVDGGQLFSYVEQEKAVEFMCLYASDFDEKANLISIEQRIISHKDNEKILADDPKLLSFKDAQNVKERYKVWKETYQLEFVERGIFEENIPAYKIGKEKYTLLMDTKPIDATDKKGKYHQFRTILRKYNVSRRENAFEVLVNLFLCKIVDEKENPNNLKFYWKGIAYDNYFDLVDRLQELYKIGMHKFLHQDIIYVSDDEIDKAFWAAKGEKGNATKRLIKHIFRDLKFFNDNNFGFIGVKNKDGFNKNAKILLEIIQMWQGLRLKTKEQNQFLGDMFEFFLDNGIKQSEGQFFTPVPICKFIVMSLPLEHQIQTKNDALRAIDYACGSGHFLTEYALQVKPLVKKHKQTKPSEYYKNIYGIEKEDRLAKVAKVSAFMYGQDEINIIDADALATNADIKNAHFDVLVANPPFAVEDFLMTLDENDREKYELLGSISDMGNKNIQCFFLERAKQLLVGDGVAGIIVPSSVLSNSDAMHVQTREILLKYFDFVAIVELGSNTFGKTGTNTVVLFLRRKAQRPEPAEHYENRALEIFDNWADEVKDEGGAYSDLSAVKKYCQHIDILFDDYQTLLAGQPSAVLLATEMFKDYKTDFDKSRDVLELEKKKFFKDFSPTQKQTELDKRFVQYLKKIERQKLYYFMLAFDNPQNVLIVKSPSDNKEQKQFLGYEWSGAKGSEGIKYNGGETVYDVITPLFDPNNAQNQEKINYFIQQNFLGHPLSIPADLQPFITLARLEDLLDFSRKDFNKAFSLLPKKNFTIETRHDVVKLGEVCKILIGGTPSRDISKYFTGNNLWVSIAEMNGTTITNTKEKITNEAIEKSNVKLIRKGTTLLSFKLSIGKTAIAGADLYTNEAIAALIPISKNKITDAYLFHLFTSKLIDLSTSNNAIGQSLNSAYLRDSVKIPLPPLSIQEQIVAECESVDQKVSNAQKAITESKGAIEDKVESVFGQYPEKKLSELAFINPSKTEIKTVDENTLVSFVEMASVSDKGFIATKIDRPLKDLKKSSYTYFAENDIIIAKITPCMENGKCAIATGLTNGLAMGSSEFHVVRAKETVSNSYLFALLNREIVRVEAEQNFTGSSGHRRVPASFYGNYKIPVPSMAEQAALILEIEQLNDLITQSQQIINDAASQKQAIMKKYL